jgi:hypothetical protein
MLLLLFNEDKNLVRSLTITSGDVILLVCGGHQITMIEKVDFNGSEVRTMYQGLR